MQIGWRCAGPAQNEHSARAAASNSRGLAAHLVQDVRVPERLDCDALPRPIKQAEAETSDGLGSTAISGALTKLGGQAGRGEAQGLTAWFLEMDLSTPGKLIQPSQTVFSGFGPLRPISCLPGPTVARSRQTAASAGQQPRAVALCVRPCPQWGRTQARCRGHTQARCHAGPSTTLPLPPPFLTGVEHVLGHAGQLAFGFQHPHSRER